MHLAQEAVGLARVLFGDESGFTENPPLTQAWAPKGEPHAHEMKTGTRRFQGLGKSAGGQVRPERSNAFVAGQRPHPHRQSHPGLVYRLGDKGIAHSFFVTVFS